MIPCPGWGSRWHLPLAAVLLAAVPCCTSSTQLTELEAGLASLEQKIDALRSQASTRDDLNVVLRGVEELLESEVSARADVKEDLRQIITEVEALRTSTQEQRRALNASLDRIGQMNDELDLLQGQMERQETHLAELRELLEASRQTTPAESVEPKALYDAAYQSYLSGDYEQAAIGFESYLGTFPNGEDADSAQYWLGESYMERGRFRTAIEELGRVAERYPDSDKVASSMLRIGVAHIELGERDLANEMLLRVRQEYPDSDEAVLALQQLDNPADQL
ncbi:MAG: tol-pal system protein YbgF [Holophagales bacterium]|nr:tol-pal system protein YbgF [Holophagales bacterium]MYH26521.1 tol-pal system protein YbgF [Holophagales bacterium]